MTKVLVHLVSYLSLCLMLLSCGTLGGFDKVPLTLTQGQVKVAVDSLFARYPEYKIPGKWKVLDDWTNRGYGFLNGRVFYFRQDPEEMYFVSFVKNNPSSGDSSFVNASIRAISIGTPRWLKESDISDADRKRIQHRFQTEILEKLK